MGLEAPKQQGPQLLQSLPACMMGRLWTPQFLGSRQLLPLALKAPREKVIQSL